MSAHLQRAMLLIEQSRHDLAETELRQALTADPHDALAHALLAMCLIRRKQYQPATEEARQAIQLAPDLPFAHYAMAHIQFERNFIDQARAAIAEAIRLDPSDADFRGLLAALHVHEHRWTDALEAAESGLALDPEHNQCLNLRGIALVKLGRKAEADATMQAALSREPEDALTHANRGWSLLHESKPQQAMEHFREALRLDPQMEWARQGIIEAMKARYFIYGWILRYFLWMAKFTKKGQWALILGVWLAVQVMNSLSKQNPALEPYLYPVLMGYMIFVFTGWLAVPFFNLVLRLNRFGRLALSREESIASTCVGGVLLLVLLFLGFRWSAPGSVFGPSWYLMALLALPTAGIFYVPSGWRRGLMILLTVVFLACNLTLNWLWKPHGLLGVLLFLGAFNVALWGPIVCTFLVGFLQSMPEKKY